MSGHWSPTSYGVLAVLLAYGLLVTVLVVDLLIGIVRLHQEYEELKARAAVTQEQWNVHERWDAVATAREQEACK